MRAGGDPGSQNCGKFVKHANGLSSPMLEIPAQSGQGPAAQAKLGIESMARETAHRASTSRKLKAEGENGGPDAHCSAMKIGHAAGASVHTNTRHLASSEPAECVAIEPSAYKISLGRQARNNLGCPASLSSAGANLSR